MTAPAAEFADLPPTLKAERHGAVVVLTLARAAKRNALDDPTVRGIENFFGALPEDVRAVVLAGAGDHFSAANADTRAALEQTVPRLREIFASGGLTLGQTNVQSDPRSGSQPTALPVRTALSHAQTVEPVAVASTHTLGLVDEYA